jgi:protein-S-isoprenylcysteine O-methyltransferase Ste14
MALIEEMDQQGKFLFRYRSFLPIIFLLSGLLVFGYHIANDTYPDLGQNYWFLSLFVGFLGLAVRIYTVGHTPANTSGRNTAEGQVAEQLNSTGIYSLVRHPLYLGNFLMWLGVAMLSADLWYLVAFVFMYWVYYERIMFHEEAFLRNKFGDSYFKWAEKTPAFWLKLASPTTPKYPFSIKKVIKKEKNGVAAMFVLFYLFEIVQNIIVNNGSFVFEKTFWFYGAVISSAVYLVLKLIKKYTNTFEEEGR